MTKIERINAALTDRRTRLRSKWRAAASTLRQFLLPVLAVLAICGPFILSYLTGTATNEWTVPNEVIWKIITGRPESGGIAYVFYGLAGVAVLRVGYLFLRALFLVGTGFFQAIALTFAATSAIVQRDFDRETGIPFPAQLVLVSLGKRHYNEILSDLLERFPSWEETYGHRRATLICYTWIASCLRVRLLEGFEGLLMPKRRSAR